MRSQYTEEWFAGFQEQALQSARYIVPNILKLTEARSILDVGCGQGAWLKAFQDNGVEDIYGLDGEYVNVDRLLIEPAHFSAHDLNKPFDLGRRYDLALCLEVGEHLSAGNAGQLIDCLCAHAPVVFFSAAIPGQGGLGHINEQWPGYWTKLFSKKDYCVFDCIRPMLWQSPEVEYWYAQNALLYARRGTQLATRLAKEPSLQGLPLVHPVAYQQTWNAAVCPSGRVIALSLAKRLQQMLRRLGKKE